MNTFTISNIKHFDPIKTFDCGQCFRFENFERKSQGIFRDMVLTIEKNDDKLTIESSKDISQEFFNETIIPFLSLDEDYDEIIDDISKYFASDTNVIEKAKIVSNGIRILKQDYFETIISFIISQNNNIPRIKKIINNISTKFGEPFSYKGNTYYTFPTPNALYDCDINELRACGTGFRDRYIKSACEYYLSNKISYKEMVTLPYEEQIKKLMQVCGIGRKVADCIILYSLHNLRGFPVDVWIKRVLDKYYGQSLDLSNLGKYPGVAQQYLFYYERYTKGEQ